MVFHLIFTFCITLAVLQYAANDFNVPPILIGIGCTIHVLIGMQAGAQGVLLDSRKDLRSKLLIWHGATWAVLIPATALPAVAWLNFSYVDAITRFTVVTGAIFLISSVVAANYSSDRFSNIDTKIQEKLEVGCASRTGRSYYLQSGVWGFRSLPASGTDRAGLLRSFFSNSERHCLQSIYALPPPHFFTSIGVEMVCAGAVEILSCTALA